MKIAMVAPPFLPIPPQNYGGSEKIVHYLTEGLVARGHDVTLYASGESVTSAKLMPVIPQALGNSGIVHNDYLSLMMYFSKCFTQYKDFDIIHSHGQFLPLFLTQYIPTPVVHTWHGSYYEGECSEERRNILKLMKDQQFITVSDNQQKGIPDLNYVGRVYNCIDTNLYTFRETNERQYVAWAGRITRKKGPKEAIQAAMACGLQLQMTAMIDINEQDYFEKEIKPFIDDKNVIFHGQLGVEDIKKLYQNALATLFPISWHEPFGLVMAESMASGTPVISYNIGSAPELVKNGVSGYLVDRETEGVEGISKAIRTLQDMSETDYKAFRTTAREHVMQNFTVEKMIDGYLAIYEKCGTIQS